MSSIARGTTKMYITAVPLTNGGLWLSAYTIDGSLLSMEYEGYEVDEAKENFIKLLVQYNLQQKEG